MDLVGLFKWVLDRDEIRHQTERDEIRERFLSVARAYGEDLKRRV